MTAAIQPGPSWCAACGSPFTPPFCGHALTALAALTTDPIPGVQDFYADPDPITAGRLLEEADLIVAAEDPDAHSKSRSDLGRYCTEFVPWEPRRTRTRRNR